MVRMTLPTSWGIGLGCEAAGGYADDQDAATSLVTVTARTNRSKADQDPRETTVSYAVPVTSRARRQPSIAARCCEDRADPDLAGPQPLLPIPRSGRLMSPVAGVPSAIP